MLTVFPVLAAFIRLSDSIDDIMEWIKEVGIFLQVIIPEARKCKVCFCLYFIYLFIFLRNENCKIYIKNTFFLFNEHFRNLIPGRENLASEIKNLIGFDRYALRV